jgi:hypothetical protein
MLLLQAGIIEEMLEDTMEGLEDSDEMEEAAQEEVDKVLYELTAGKYTLSFYWPYRNNHFRLFVAKKV